MWALSPNSGTPGPYITVQITTWAPFKWEHLLRKTATRPSSLESWVIVLAMAFRTFPSAPDALPCHISSSGKICLWMSWMLRVQRRTNGTAYMHLQVAPTGVCFARTEKDLESALQRFLSLKWQAVGEDLARPLLIVALRKAFLIPQAFWGCWFDESCDDLSPPTWAMVKSPFIKPSSPLTCRIPLKEFCPWLTWRPPKPSKGILSSKTDLMVP